MSYYIHGAAEIIASLPLLYGSHPDNCFLCITATVTESAEQLRIGDIYRVDLEDTAGINNIARQLTGETGLKIFGLMVTPQPADQDHPWLQQIIQQFQVHGVPVDTIWQVAVIQPGAAYQAIYLAETQGITPAWKAGKVAVPPAALKQAQQQTQTANNTPLSRLDYDPDPSLANKLDELHKDALDLGYQLCTELWQAPLNEIGAGNRAPMYTLKHTMERLETPELTVARLKQDEELMLLGGMFAATNFGRDLVIGWLVRYPHRVFRWFNAVAQTFPGHIRANALTLMALAAAELNLTQIVVPAFEAALATVDAHSLARLCLEPCYRGHFFVVRRLMRRVSTSLMVSFWRETKKAPPLVQVTTTPQRAAG